MNFLEAQGLKIRRNYYYQDNESAMRLERNGIQSAGKKSRHIDIRFFFIKDRIKKGDIHLLYCPTEDMLADFLSKPLQGHLFIRFRDQIMGITPVTPIDDPSLRSAPAQERVGNSDYGADGQRTDDPQYINVSSGEKLTWADHARMGMTAKQSK